MDTFVVVLEAWIPFQIPAYDFEERYPVFEEVRDSLVHDMPEALAIISDNPMEISASFAEPPESVLGWLQSRSFFVGTDYNEHMLVRAQITIDVAELVRLNDGKQFDEEFLCTVAAMDLVRALNIILLLCELAAPGVVSTSEGLVTHNGVDVETVKGKCAY